MKRADLPEELKRFAPKGQVNFKPYLFVDNALSDPSGFAVLRHDLSENSLKEISAVYAKEVQAERAYCRLMRRRKYRLL